MLSSQNYVRETGVLRSGEVISSDIPLEVLNDPSTIVYRHSAKGARFFMPDGASIIFLGGVFITNNKDIQNELNKVADKQGTQITTDEKALLQLRGELKAAVQDAMEVKEGDKLSAASSPAPTPALSI